MRRYVTLLLFKMNLIFAYTANGFIPSVLNDGDYVVNYPEEAHIRQIEAMSEWILNDTERYLVQQFLLYCPGQDMCLGDQFHMIFQFEKAPSCHQCNCKHNCFRIGNCCPTKLITQNVSIPKNIIHYDFKNKMKSKYDTVPLQCVKPKLNYLSKVSPPKSYWMINQCPSLYPDETMSARCNITVEKCTDDHVCIPVTSTASNETFKNIFCAKCHGEKETDLYHWKKIITCDSRFNLYDAVASGNMMNLTFMNDSNCNFGFRPPSMLSSSVETCKTYGDHVVSECNVTGEWITYDQNIEHGCKTLRAFFFGCTGTLYKNIFCFLCNIHPEYQNEIQVQCEADTLLRIGDFSNFPTFSALLDFNDVTAEPDLYQTGSTGGVCDSNTGTCWKTACQPGYILKGQKCQPVYTEVAENNYEVSLLIEPTQQLKTQYYQVFQSLSTYFEYFIDSRNLARYICRFVLLTNVLDLNAEFNVQEFYAVLVMELSVGNFHNVQNFTEELLSVFNFGGLSLQIMINDHEIDSNFTVRLIGQEFHVLKDTLFGVQFKDRHYYNPMNNDILYKYFFKPFQGREVGERNSLCDMGGMMSVVADWSICPMVILPKHDVVAVVADFKVCLHKYKMCIDSQFFKESVDKSAVEICRSQLGDALDSNPNSDLLEEKILTVICLSLSCLGCVLTLVGYILSSELHNVQGLNTIALSTTLLLANICYICTKLAKKYDALCILFGVLSHYCWISVVSWMSISCFQIFRTITNHFAIDSRTDKKTSRFLCCFFSNVSFSVIPVSVNVMDSYFNEQNGHFGYSLDTCYIAESRMNLYTFALPIAIMVVLNLFMFVTVAIRVREGKVLQKSNDRKLLKIYCKLSTITGGTWLFGFMHQIFEVQIFSYMNILLNGSQGLFLWFAFGLTSLKSPQSKCPILSKQK